MDDLRLSADDRVLILGATGFIGRKLAPELHSKGIMIRLFGRSLTRLSQTVPPGAHCEVVQGDVVSGEGLEEALRNVHTAFYLVHSMGGRTIFKNAEYAGKDKQAARNFTETAGRTGLRRVIYLGALGETHKGLSEHLKSRAEVASIISSGKPSATILRAAIIIGAGGSSFEMLRYLVERLPVMGCPKWIDTKIQPIALRDVISYLTGCLLNPRTAGKSFDIGGPDVLTYREMMQQYAEARGIARRLIFRVPFLTPLLSAYWVDLVTPVPSGVAHPLIEGLKSEVICRDNSIDDFVKIDKAPFREAVRAAFSEEKDGPGVTGF